MPATEHPESLLSQHEQGLLQEAQLALASLDRNHRSESFNQEVIPRCRPIVEAIGHRLAYDAAVKAGVQPALLTLYECHVVGKDVGWYIENGLITRAELRSRETTAANSLQAEIPNLLRDLEVEEYALAPIISAKAWEQFVSRLPSFNASVRQNIGTPEKVLGKL